MELTTGATSYSDEATGNTVAPSAIVACPVEAPYSAVNANPSFTSVSTAGNTAAGLQSVTITNVGAAAGTVQGSAINVGESVSFSAYIDPVTRQFHRLAAIAYSGVGTTLHIATMP
jgi:hypothetical protein